MASLLDRADSLLLKDRFSRLQSETRPLWGKFTAPEMLSHIIQSLGTMEGSVATVPVPTPWVMRNWPLKHLLIHVLPFPKSLATSPELLARESLPVHATDETWSSELRVLDEALDGLVELGETRAVWPDHVGFGPLSGHQWGVLQYRHLDHHLRQFGL